MKTWQVVILIYLTTAIVSVELAKVNSSVITNVIVAFGITLAGLLLIRRLKKIRNPNK
jgi:hypothetical protein